MKKTLKHALIYALLLTIGFNGLSLLLGLITRHPYETTFRSEAVFFVLTFILDLIDSWRKKRKKGEEQL